MPITIDPEAYYSDPEIGRDFGASDQDLIQARQAGTLKSIKNGGTWMTSGRELSAFLKSRTYEPPAKRRP